MERDCINDFVMDLANNEVQSVITTANDPGYILKKVIEYCDKYGISYGTAILSRYFDNYYMGENVNIPFKLPVLVVIVNENRYELQCGEDPKDNIVIADRLPDDFEIRQQISELNYLIWKQSISNNAEIIRIIKQFFPELDEYLLKTLEKRRLNGQKTITSKLFEETGIVKRSK